VGSEVGARRQPFAARGWAIAALLGIVAIWTLRETQHERAIQLAMAQSIEAPPSAEKLDMQLPPDSLAPAEAPPVYLQAQRALASPDPLSPFHWYAVTDFGPLYQLAEADTKLGTLVPSQAIHPKLDSSPQLLAAEGSPLGRVYLDWSPMPFITIDTIAKGDPGADPAHTIVDFADPRFICDAFLLHTGHTPLTGKVELDANNHIVRQTLDGRVQRP